MISLKSNNISENEDDSLINPRLYPILEDEIGQDKAKHIIETTTTAITEMDTPLDSMLNRRAPGFTPQNYISYQILKVVSSVVDVSIAITLRLKHKDIFCNESGEHFYFDFEQEAFRETFEKISKTMDKKLDLLFIREKVEKVIPLIKEKAVIKAFQPSYFWTPPETFAMQKELHLRLRAMSKVVGSRIDLIKKGLLEEVVNCYCKTKIDKDVAQLCFTALTLDEMDYPKNGYKPKERYTTEEIKEMVIELRRPQICVAKRLIEQPHRVELVKRLEAEPYLEIDEDDYRYRFIPKELHEGRQYADKYIIITKLLDRLDGSPYDLKLVNRHKAKTN